MIILVAMKTQISRPLSQPGSEPTVIDLAGGTSVPLVLTPDVQRGLDMIRPLLTTHNKHSFLVVGPVGCGKELLLCYSFEQLCSVQVAIIRCSGHLHQYWVCLSTTGFLGADYISQGTQPSYARQVGH